MRDRTGLDPDWRRWGEEIECIGGETIIRVHYMIKEIFSIT